VPPRPPPSKKTLDAELAKLAGHPAVVNVWASWCGPCNEEAPIIQRVALNRGILLTPFHNMALFSPHHTEADVDRHTDVFDDALTALLG